MGKSPYNWTVVRLSQDNPEKVVAIDFDDLFFQLEKPEDVIMVIRQELA